MTDNRNLLKLIPEQREDLQRWAHSRTLPAGDVFRSRLILALAYGATYREIARSLKTSLPTIARWKMRFERDGLAGLEGRHLGSKPRAATPKVQARVIRRVQQKPGDGSTHCIRRSMQLYFASMKRRQFRLWIGSTRCCRCRRGERNGMASNTTATARFRYMRLWM